MEVIFEFVDDFESCVDRGAEEGEITDGAVGETLEKNE